MKLKCDVKVDDTIEDIEYNFENPPKFKKVKSSIKEPFIIEEHYAPNAIASWGWIKVGSYSTEKRAKQALDFLKKKNVRNISIIDDYRMYDIREEKPDKEKKERKWIELKR
jgi:hypothetical protein